MMAASMTIPYAARFLLTTLEPLFAFGGVLTVLFAPAMYVSTTTRGATTFNTSQQFIFTSQAGSWLYFAFVEAIVLRNLDDLKTWRLLAAGMLCSDILYCHSVAQGVGGWKVWLDVFGWTVEDWVVTITTWPFVLIRVLIAAGYWHGGKLSSKKV